MSVLPEEDRIHYAIAQHKALDRFPGRIELGFRNLTKAEAAQLLLVLDKMQMDRKTALYLGDAVTLDVASKPESTAREFAREHGLDPANLQGKAGLTNAALHEFAGEHGVNIDKFTGGAGHEAT